MGTSSASKLYLIINPSRAASAIILSHPTKQVQLVLSLVVSAYQRTWAHKGQARRHLLQVRSYSSSLSARMASSSARCQKTKFISLPSRAHQITDCSLLSVKQSSSLWTSSRLDMNQAWSSRPPAFQSSTQTDLTWNMPPSPRASSQTRCMPCGEGC